MLAQRLLILLAVLLGLAVVAAMLQPLTRSSPPSYPIEPPAAGANPPADVQATLDAGQAPRTVAVDEGDDVQLTVNVDEIGAVEVVGLDQLQAATPDSPAVFDIRADRPGAYPVQTTDGREIGTLRVSSGRE